MSQTDPTDDWGDEGRESEDSQAGAPKAPTIEELKAAAAAAQDSLSNMDAEMQKAFLGNHQDNQQHRAKKAQKTKGRVKINAPPTQDGAKKKPKHQPEPADDQDDDEEEEIEEEPSKLASAIMGCFQAFGNFFKKIFQFIFGLFVRVWGLFIGLLKLMWKLICKLVPLLVGVPLYCLILYLTSEYLVNHFDSSQQLDMGYRFNYLLRCHAFTMIPVMLGLVASSQCAGEAQQRFYHESFQQTVLLFINSLIMSAHCSSDQLHWICCITIGYLTFSLPYWISLGYGCAKLQSTLRSPIIVTNIALMLYNVVILTGQNYGYFSPDPVVDHSESAGAYWQFSMCDRPQMGYCGDLRPQFGYEG